MAKRPLPGAVKTRLIPALGAEEAAGFYERSLSDVLEFGAPDGPERFCFVHPPGDRLWFESRAVDWRVEAQRGPDLGHRMVAVFDELFGRGHSPVVMRNSDSPTLPPAHLEQALRALASDRCDVVLGPDLGGGYALVGLSRPAPFLFLDVPMSTDSMEQATCRRARQEGLRVLRLEPWLDVDEPDDLEALRRQMDEPELAARAPRVADWFRRRTQGEGP